MTTSGAQNRLIGGRRASRRADMEQFSKLISQAKLLCTGIHFFENFSFEIQIKNCDDLEISSETAKVISFSATFFKMLRFSKILSWTASWFLKNIFGFPLFAITLTTFYSLEPFFLSHLGHESLLNSVSIFWWKINSPCNFALHKSWKLHDNCWFLMHTFRWPSDLHTSVWSFSVLPSHYASKWFNMNWNSGVLV